MTIETPKKLPSRDLLPLATTVERVYAETPTWLLAVAFAIALALLVALGCSQQNRLDAYQDCVYQHGGNDSRCVALAK